MGDQRALHTAHGMDGLPFWNRLCRDIVQWEHGLVICAENVPRQDGGKDTFLEAGMPDTQKMQQIS